MQTSPHPGEELQTTHSFILAAALHPKDTETTPDESSQQKKKKPSLFPAIIESNAEEEEKEAKLQNIKNNGIWQKAWSWPLSEGDGLISE